MLELSRLDNAPNIVPMFVYGTLRPGGRLHDWWIKDAVVDTEPAVVTGFSLRDLAGAYPLMVREVGQITHGDILWLDRNHPYVYDTIQMELETGYTLDMIEADVNAAVPIPVLAFIWTGDGGGLPRVPSNDWIAT